MGDRAESRRPSTRAAGQTQTIMPPKVIAKRSGPGGISWALRDLRPCVLEVSSAPEQGNLSLSRNDRVVKAEMMQALVTLNTGVRQ